MNFANDVLSGDTDEVVAARKAQQAAEGLAFAQNYLVFAEDPRGRALLAHWGRTIGRMNVPPNASHGEAMFYAGQRALFNGILQQIEFAAGSATK
jgi:hypothetical protein